MISPIKFKKILNDIKRRPEDAALELGVSKETIEDYLSGKITIPFNIVSKAVEIWSINYSEFFDIEDDTTEGYKIMTQSESDKSQRLMKRNDKPYYLYKDTAYSRLSPFKPEWIEELVTVENNDPNNSEVVYNNGHFLHQFTYFIGEVNFYYIEDGVKKVAEMSTGDSMYISPYIPHSFTTRKNKENKNGLILALTYADKMDYGCIDEISAIGKELGIKYKLKLDDQLEAFKSNLKYYLKVTSISLEELSFRINDNEINRIFDANQLPSFEKITKISESLNIFVRDLLPIYNDYQVKILKYDESKKWLYPSKENNKYEFTELAGVKKLPISRALELLITSDTVSEDVFLETPLHQYIYNIGIKKCIININNKNIELNKDESIYLKPNLKHSFNGIGAKLLILRTGGKISGDVLYHFSMINKNELARTIEDNKPWFNY